MTDHEHDQPDRTRAWRFRHIATRYLDPFLRPFATRAPFFGVITHRGRKSGRIYRTPVNVFRRGDSYLFFLTYGSDVQWVKNVLAAGSCEIETRGRVIVLGRPQIVIDPTRRLVPRVVAVFLGLIDVTEFLRMEPAGNAARPI